jgi:hypothetical protein
LRLSWFLPLAYKIILYKDYTLLAVLNRQNTC